MKQKKTIAQRISPKSLPVKVRRQAREKAEIEFQQFLSDGQARLELLPSNQLKLF